MREKYIEKLYELLERAEKENDNETISALRLSSGKLFGVVFISLFGCTFSSV